MKLKVKRGIIPDAEELITLYNTKTLKQIGEYYGVSTPRVSRWFSARGITKRPRGGGNNRQYDIDYDIVSEMVRDRVPCKQIAKTIGCSVSNLRRWLMQNNITFEYNTKPYRKYARRVRALTEAVYVKFYKQLNPHKYPRTLCGVPGGYQLDHIKSIRYCFDNNIAAEKCAGVDNLQMITWQENLNKRFGND